MNADDMIKKFGNSSTESRNAILEAFDSAESLKESAMIWGDNHNIKASKDDTFVAFAVALDLGWRIANRCK